MEQAAYIFQKNQQITGYTIVFPIKQGAYAETYRVKDANGRLRFLKVICLSKLQSSQLDVQGRVIEVQIVKSLFHHTNICDYIDDGMLILEGQKYVYLVTDFVSGETVSQRVARGADFSVYEIKQIVLNVLSALRFLHSQIPPIIHNEISIQNILLDLTVGMTEPKLIDFGHAQYLNTVKINDFSIKDMNLFYFASERFSGIYGVQSDLYSVGVVIYHLLFGIVPWFVDLSNLTEKERINCILRERKKPLKLPNLELFELDEQLINVIKKALEDDIENRFQSADEFMQALNGEIELKPMKPDKISVSLQGEKNFINRGNGFADVAGMSELKKLLYNNVINILKNPERARKYKLSIPNGMLLYGPPGCGKNFFAEKFAEETGYNYIYVKSSDLASIYVHGSQEKIGKLFDKAREKAPTILCFDEFDSLVPNRDRVNSASQSGEVNEFLSQP